MGARTDSECGRESGRESTQSRQYTSAELKQKGKKNSRAGRRLDSDRKAKAGKSEERGTRQQREGVQLR
jgi:hypothetical protein